MGQLRLLWERVRRRWWLIALAGVLAAVGSAGAVLLDEDAYLARATLTNASPGQDRDPAEERVLTQGYADFVNQPQTQDALRAAAGVGPDITVSARSALGAPLLYVEATGPDPTRVETAAEDVAQRLAADVNAGLGPIDDPDEEELLRGLQLDAGVAPTGSPVGQTAFAAGVGGVLLGALLAIAAGRYERRLVSVREIDDRLGLDVLAVVGRRSDRRELLRAMMTLTDAEGMPRPGTLAVTGPTATQGSQARVALALAGLRAAQGRTTLLLMTVPAPDLLPRVLATAEGVSDVLARDPEGTAGLLAARVLGDGSGLLIGPPGSRTDDAVALYSKAQFDRLLAQGTALADLVVVLAPPADTPEGRGVCATTDRSLVVVEQGRTRTRDGHTVLDGLAAVGATALGAVLVHDPDHVPDPGFLAGDRPWVPARGPVDHTAPISLPDLVGASSRALPTARPSPEES